MKSLPMTIAFALLVPLQPPSFTQDSGIPETELSKCIRSEAAPHLHILNVDRTRGGYCAVARGDSVQIRLPIKPGTGYQWFVESATSAFKQVGEGKLVPSTSDAPGATETEVLTFIIERAGNQKLVLGYARDKSSYGTRFVLYAKAS